MLLLACGAAGRSAALACGEALGADVRRIERSPFVLAYRPTPDADPGGPAFRHRLRALPARGAALPAEVRVDATMPEHKHGMNYRPSVKALAPAPTAPRG